MRERLQEFALSLHPDKTRLLEFGRFAAANRKRRGLGKPETFTFLGFTFICGRTRQGDFQIHRKTRRDRMQAKLTEIKEELRRRMHQSIRQQGRWLRPPATTTTMPCRPTAVPWRRSATTSSTSGDARCGDAARRTARRGRGSPTTGSPNRASFTLGRSNALPSDTRGGSRMRECRTYGSVRGVRSNTHSYRNSLC